MRDAILSRPTSRGAALMPALDALRGVAILAVFVQHLGDRFAPLWERDAQALGPAAPWVLTVLHHAWWGVDLFFVVSGFSLALGYLRAYDAGEAPTPAAAFFARRAVRILPAFAVALAITIAARPSVVDMPGFSAAIASHAALLQGYWSPGGVVFIGAAWSLTTEAHFYLLVPLLAGPLLRRRAYALCAALCAATYIARAALFAALLEPGVYSGLFELTQRRLIVSRLDQFLLGMLAAALYTDLQRRPRALLAWATRFAPAALVLSVALLVVAFRVEGATFLSPGGSLAYALMSLATAAIVLSACLLGAGDPPRRSALAAPLCALGVVSYGVFLYHQLALGIAGSRLGAPSAELTWGRMAAEAAAALTASIALGILSWVLLERPLLRRMFRARPPARAPRAASDGTSPHPGTPMSTGA